MSSLYQCRTRVGYRPFKSDKLIVFDERQIQEVSIDLKWQPGLGNLNQDSATTPTGATNALNQSKCSVTISDPYLSGLAWPVLYDAAAIYTASNIAAANNIIFPACGDGQDPVTDKCFKYVDIETDDTVSSGGDFAFLIISLWYEVKGTTFGTDFYFRVDGFGISHGSNFPNVTIKGVEARSILFNQSLLNLTFDEGAEIEKVLKDIAERFDYSTSFCLNSNTDPQKKRLLPRSIRFKGVTADEAIQKVLDSVGGTTSTLPLREYANKITMCTRGEFSSRSCSVFYLGKGLYERYEINGQPQLTLLGQNQEFGGNRNDEDPYKSQSFESASYVIQDLVPNRRKQELEKVKKIQFPKLFDPVSKHIGGSSRGTSGVVWRTIRPAPATSGGKVQVTSEKVKDTNLFGIAPNGSTAISFLRGIVREADGSQGRVLIGTGFGLRVCKPEDNSKCFHRQIFQESTGLSTIKVKVGDEVEENREIGTSTEEKPEFTRFFITGHNAERITLLPQLVWDWAVPEGEFRRFAQSAISPVTSTDRVIPPPPKSNAKNWSATTSNKPKGILIMAGHADDTSGADSAGEAQINIELVRWAERNAKTYGIDDFVQFYIPTSRQINKSDPSSQFSKTRQAVDNGLQVIEIHLDEPRGRSGVIPPLIPARKVPGFNPVGRRQNVIWPLDDELAKFYGAFSKTHRSEPGDPAPLGVPNRGGTILEVGVLTPQLQGIFRTGTSEQRNALFKQLMDPVMRSIASERSRGGSTPSALPPPPSTTAPPTSQRICFRMGDSGRSTGPHLHAQWDPVPRPITAADVRKYVDVAGSVPSSGNFGDRGGGHKGVDISNSLGTPICLKEGVVVKQVADAKCPNGQGRESRCGKPGFEGFGNVVIISTPEGDMLLAHLDSAGIPPNITGLRSSSSGGNTRPNIQSNPVTTGLALETSFKGVPRALRIIPGQTILSFISDYDDWLENGGPRGGDNGRDPGVWIPKRFSNWFVTECNYKWRSGDLRVDLEGKNAWGTSEITVPTFSKYLETMKKSGDIKSTSDYYGYIRSIGDLNWKVEQDGELKDSTEVYCKEAQDWAASQGAIDVFASSTSPTAIQDSFPSANCEYIGTKYPKDRVNALIRAARSVGITNKAAYAGILGNGVVESTFQGQFFNPLANNGNRTYGFDGCVGVFQWCDRRAGLRRFAQTSGKSEFDFNTQLRFFVAELTAGSGYTDSAVANGIVQKLNAARSPEEAANIFNSLYERAPGQAEQKRRNAAREIFNQMRCLGT